MLKINNSGGSKDWVVLNSNALRFIELKKERLRRDKKHPSESEVGYLLETPFHGSLQKVRVG